MPVHFSLSPSSKKSPVNLRFLQRQTEQLQHLLGLENAIVSVVLMDDAEMAAYNEQYRHKRGPTNVLSFPAGEGESGFSVPDNELGDILISVETALREAVAEKHSLHHRRIELIIHGLLHLMGWDHERSEEEAIRRNNFV